jgi:hypothetical protein
MSEQKKRGRGGSKKAALAEQVAMANNTVAEMRRAIGEVISAAVEAGDQYSEALALVMDDCLRRIHVEVKR